MAQTTPNTTANSAPMDAPVTWQAVTKGLVRCQTCGLFASWPMRNQNAEEYHRNKSPHCPATSKSPGKKPQRPLAIVPSAYEAYNTIASREESFNLPEAGRLQWSALRLAEAGFFYSAEEDVLVCFHCALRLDKHNVNPTPMDVHLRLNPDCPYVVTKKGGIITSQLSDKEKSFFKKNKSGSLPSVVMPMGDHDGTSAAGDKLALWHCAPNAMPTYHHFKPVYIPREFRSGAQTVSPPSPRSVRGNRSRSPSPQSLSRSTSPDTSAPSSPRRRQRRGPSSNSDGYVDGDGQRVQQRRQQNKGQRSPAKKQPSQQQPPAPPKQQQGQQATTSPSGAAGKGGRRRRNRRSKRRPAGESPGRVADSSAAATIEGSASGRRSPVPASSGTGAGSAAIPLPPKAQRSASAKANPPSPRGASPHPPAPAASGPPGVQQGRVLAAGRPSGQRVYYRAVQQPQTPTSGQSAPNQAAARQPSARADKSTSSHSASSSRTAYYRSTYTVTGDQRARMQISVNNLPPVSGAPGAAGAAQVQAAVQSPLMLNAATAASVGVPKASQTIAIVPAAEERDIVTPRAAPRAAPAPRTKPFEKQCRQCAAVGVIATFDPCRHGGYCVHCASEVTAGGCPTCGARVTNLMIAL